MPIMDPPPPSAATPTRNLSEFERNELRQALMFHFEDCLHSDFEQQWLVIECVVERILNRRAFVAARAEAL